MVFGDGDRHWCRRGDGGTRGEGREGRTMGGREGRRERERDREVAMVVAMMATAVVAMIATVAVARMTTMMFGCMCDDGDDGAGHDGDGGGGEDGNDNGTPCSGHPTAFWVQRWMQRSPYRLLDAVVILPLKSRRRNITKRTRLCLLKPPSVGEPHPLHGRIRRSEKQLLHDSQVPG